MIHLIQCGLMFGNLIHIASPALVERYNRALKHLTNHHTNLTEFHIDISGYSPEIGDELNDHLYLNRAGVNRQFILLTTDQKNSTVVQCEVLDLARNSQGIYHQERTATLCAHSARRGGG